MAETVNCVNYDDYNSGSYGDNWIDQGKIKGNLHVWTDSYEASALETGSTISIAELPEGAVVLHVRVVNDDMGSTVTLSVGDSDDPDRYISASNMTTGNTVTESDVIGGINYVIGTNDGDTTITGTTDGIFTGTLKFQIMYAL